MSGLEPSNNRPIVRIEAAKVVPGSKPGENGEVQVKYAPSPPSSSPLLLFLFPSLFLSALDDKKRR